MAKRMLRTLIGTAGLMIAAGVGQADSIADTMTLAYRNSGLLEQNRALLRAADEDVALAVSALRPIINWQANVTHTRTVANFEAGRRVVGTSTGGAISVPFDAGVNVSHETTATLGVTMDLLLYDFGGSKLAVDAAKELVLATRQSLVQQEQTVLLRAVQAHMGVRRASEVLALQRSNVSLVQGELQAARDRFEVGEVTRTDVSAAESRLAQVRAEVAAAEGDLARAISEYRAVTGQKPGSLDAVPPVNLRRSQDSAETYAVQNHPAILEVRHNVSAAELNIKRAEAAMKPQARLNGQIGIDQNANSRQQLGITVGGPIYQGGALSARLRQAMARRDAARASLHSVSGELRKQVSDAYAVLKVTDLAINASSQQVRASRSAFDGIREEAKLGSRTTLEVLDAEQRLLGARVGVVSAQIDKVVASYNVMAATGLLTAEHMNLPVKRYDPTAYYQLVEKAPAIRSQQGQALDRVLRAIGD